MQNNNKNEPAGSEERIALLQDQVAGNGLISRRHLLGLSLAGAGSLVTSSVLAADAGMLPRPAWSMAPGRDPSEYGNPSSHAQIKRLAPPPNTISPGTGASRTPLHLLQGTITPNSLHFERHHAGVPDIDPAQHRLVLHGMVRQPLEFSYEDLLAYPMVSRVYFLECSGNSGANSAGASASDNSAGGIHGLLSCAEWTGVRLSTLLDEAGVAPGASWITATGADAASLGRSVPLDKALRDVTIALYQNGEPIRPEQGYPMRMFVPGWEGNVSVKWLTQIKVTNGPANFRDETSRYTELLPDGKSLQFTYPMGVKSVITSPSGQMTLTRRGLHEVTGLAWSGSGSIRRVEISADGGRTWADALIDADQRELALTRFRLPWLWEGAEAVLQSRATDSAGNVQPSRAAWVAQYSPANRYHYNGIQSWAVSAQGEVKNVYA